MDISKFPFSYFRLAETCPGKDARHHPKKATRKFEQAMLTRGARRAEWLRVESPSRLVYCLRMIFSENRCTFFRITRYWQSAEVT